MQRSKQHLELKATISSNVRNDRPHGAPAATASTHEHRIA